MSDANKAFTLSAEDIESYHRDGYLIARGLFDRDDIERLRDIFTKAVENGPLEGLSDYKNIKDPDDPLYQYARFMHPHQHPEYPEIAAAAREKLLDTRIERILTALMEEEPLAAQSMVYFKPPGARGQDFHQDNFYLKIRPGTCMAAWIALDDADAGNGGLRVVPGSHDLDVLCPEHGRSDNEIFFSGDHVDDPAGRPAIQTELKAGDVLFFNGSLIHGSYPNSAEERFRRALICHYAPRSVEEKGEFYDLLTFDGSPVNRPNAKGGGPCGDVTPRPGA